MSSTSTSPALFAPSVPPVGPPELVSFDTWPPRILWTRVPLRTRARDVLLTIAAWTAFVAVLRKPIVNFIAWIDPPRAARLKVWIPVDYAVDTRPFLVIAAVLIMLLVTMGMLRRAYLGRAPSVEHDVPPLSTTAQFMAAGVPASQEAVWRTARHLMVRHKCDGKLLEARELLAAGHDSGGPWVVSVDENLTDLQAGEVTTLRSGPLGGSECAGADGRCSS